MLVFEVLHFALLYLFDIGLIEGVSINKATFLQACIDHELERLDQLKESRTDLF